MLAKDLIGNGVPEGFEIIMQGRDIRYRDMGPTGTVGVVFIGKRGGVNVIMATGPHALETVNVHRETQFTFQRKLPGIDD
jgi:hypothetical protein